MLLISFSLHNGKYNIMILFCNKFGSLKKRRPEHMFVTGVFM